MAHESKLNTRLDTAGGTLYDFIGGRGQCQRLSELFHSRIEQDAVLKDIFPKNLLNLTEHFALFLVERLGGAAEYTAKRGKQSLRCRHAHLSLGTVEAERWLGHMFSAIDECSIMEPARQRLRDYFTETARTLADPFALLYKLPLDELRVILDQNPTLATASDLGRTLLSDAAFHWDISRVQMLLEYGANVNTEDRLGHSVLYQTTRSSAGAETESCAVVELLIRHGADVNARSGPGQSTPLHMAARRGHVAMAEVLLDAEAEIEMRDSKGETPLRRAVNCGQKGVVLLLLARGADPLSQDKQGNTVLAVARHEDIRNQLQTATRRR